MNEDIRWIQRFENFEKAFKKLDEGVKTAAAFIAKNPDDKIISAYHPAFSQFKSKMNELKSKELQ